jgi:hypothetical protein
MWGGQSVGGGRGVFAGEDSISGDTGGVYHTGGGETPRSWRFWGKLGGWDTFQGCSGGSGGVLRRSEAAVRGSEWGRAGDLVVVGKRVNDDVVVVLGVSG